MAKSIKDQLANVLGRRDEVPNIILAEKISKSSDKDAVEELIGLVNHKTTRMRHDAIKTIYEIAERKPELIAVYYKEILNLLDHKDNRMIWGAMHALSALSNVKPDLLAKNITNILDAMDHGSVITRDHGIFILCRIASLKKYHNDCIELLLEQLQKAPVNQFPMYAERTAEVATPADSKRLEKIILSRHDVAEVPSKNKRIEKVLKSLSNK
jgi:hypothetical protein